MDDLYISLDGLKEMGLIKKTKKFNANKKIVDYEAVRAFKTPYYKEAYSNFIKNKEFKTFASQEWVKNYAVFLTFKKNNNMNIWHEWPTEQREWIKNKKLDLTPNQDQIDYEIIIQYI